ncbi:hypothetical protein GCM10022140_53830 [Rhodococcus aetherivorans]
MIATIVVACTSVEPFGSAMRARREVADGCATVPISGEQGAATSPLSARGFSGIPGPDPVTVFTGFGEVAAPAR